MMQIAQREECHLRMMIHYSSRKKRHGPKPGWTRLRLTLRVDSFRSAEGPRKIGWVELHSIGGQLSCRFRKSCPLGDQLVLGALAIGGRFELDVHSKMRDLTIVEIDFLMKRLEEIFIVRHFFFFFLRRFFGFGLATFPGFAVNRSKASSGVSTGDASMKPSG